MLHVMCPQRRRRNWFDPDRPIVQGRLPACITHPAKAKAVPREGASALVGGGVYSFSPPTSSYRCARVVSNQVKNISTNCLSCLNSLKQIFLQVVKNKCAPPYKIAEFDIMFGSGISSLGCLLDAAEGVDVVQRKGSWYSFGDQKLGQGREKTLAILAESKDMQRYACLDLSCKAPSHCHGRHH